MNKTIIVLMFLFGFSASYAQDCCDKVVKLGIEKDSMLKQVVLPLNDSITTLNDSITKLNTVITSKEDSIRQLRADKEEFEKKEANWNEKAVKIKNDTLRGHNDKLKFKIKELKDSLTFRDIRIVEIQEEGEEKAIKEKKNGKNEILQMVSQSYKINTFDDILGMSNRESIMRDKQFIELIEDTDVKQILDDLEIYFEAEELFSKKFDKSVVKMAIKRVSTIKPESEAVNKLKDKLKNFEIFNNGLVETLQKIIEIDNKESANGMSEQIKNRKRDKIVSELTSYIFDYNLNFIDYPYLSDIVLEIIKEKHSNVDVDLSDLLKKLQ